MMLVSSFKKNIFKELSLNEYKTKLCVFVLRKNLFPFQLASRKKRESDPMVQGYGYNSAWILNPMYQRTMYNGIYAYNHLAYAGYNNPRFNYGFYY